MNKFHQIPTDTFVPVDHDNSYLFNHYDKVANFLAFNLEKNYKNILAKPVQNGYLVDWFSVYENLTNSNQKSTAETETSLLKYWEFIEIINTKILKLSNSKEENDKNWASLLTKVFNHKDNFVFSNGNDICIVWGWKFNNNEIYRPNISKSPNTFLNPDRNAVSTDNLAPNSAPEIQKTEPKVAIPEPIIEPKPTSKAVIDEVSFIETPIDETPAAEVNTTEESSFLKFLKWFASKFWWWLWLLLLLIILFLLLKSCDCNDRYNEIDNKLNQLEQKASDCAN